MASKKSSEPGSGTSDGGSEGPSATRAARRSELRLELAKFDEKELNEIVGEVRALNNRRLASIQSRLQENPSLYLMTLLSALDDLRVLGVRVDATHSEVLRFHEGPGNTLDPDFDDMRQRVKFATQRLLSLLGE